jgi:hypothetical protein
MNSHDFEFKEFEVSKAIGLSFHGFDLVVGALQGSGGDGVVIVGQDAGSMSGHGTPHLRTTHLRTSSA